MSKKFINSFLTLTFCVSLLAGVVGPVHAWGGAVLLSPTLEMDDRNADIVDDPNIVTWSMLGIDETHLVGPDDSIYYEFGLPADWRMVSGTELTLSFLVSINTGLQNLSVPTPSVQSDPTPIANFAVGTVTVIFNDSVLDTIPLNQVGEFQRNISIPVDAFNSNRKDRRMVIGFILNSGISCYYFNQVDVVIRTTSFFNLPHESILPKTDLVNFPQPIYQYTFIKDSALLVIPDQPTAFELRAGLVLASGLSKLTDGNLAVDVVTQSKLTMNQKANNHLVYVGKVASLPGLNQLQLPLPPFQGAFQIPGGSSDDGLVEMVNSPWSDSHVVLVVSGNTDQGTIKAAQAVSSGVLRPNRFPNLSIVQDVQENPLPIPQPDDQTLADLGYKGRIIENRGVRNISYYFNVLPGFMVSSEANFELVYGHSSLINYERSGIVVLLNDKPIGSIRMNDVSAALSTNKIKIGIPPSAIMPGKNRLDIRITLIPTDVCTPSNAHGLWVNIWPESMLHLPLDRAPINPILNLDLTSYPAPFVFYAGLENTAFVVQRNDLESFRAAMKISEYMGLIAGGPVSELNTFYGDDFPQEERSKYNLLLIGRPSQMPVVADINNNLPVPFLDGKDVAAENGFQVIYRIPLDSPMGYIEMLSSPWNPDHVILAVLGNTLQGLNWATMALVDSDLRSKLAGNFAVINDDQIITADTRLSPAIDSGVIQNPVVVILPTSVPTTTPVQQFTWVFPMFVTSIILIIILLAFVTIRRWFRNRTRAQNRRSLL